jgi:hypothetical protein
MRDLLRSGAIAGAVAAVATTTVAAVASAADVPLEIDGEDIPIVAFAWWTIIAAALGIVLARLIRPRRRFVFVATALVALSLIPAIAAPDDGATKVVLVAAHLLAAAIIIPALGREVACAVPQSSMTSASPSPAGS